VCDLPVPAEFLSLFPSRSNVLIETLLAARSDNAPFEWAAIFRADILPAGEAILIVRADPKVPVERRRRVADVPGAAIRGTVAAERSDLLLLVEALLAATRDGAYLELGSAVLLDPPAPAEGRGDHASRSGSPAEAASSAARADISAQIEALLAVARSGPQAEWLAVVRALVVANIKAPLEWTGVIRTDAALAVEVTALSGSDLAALMEWFRTLISDGRPPAEWASTAPAPILVVSGGRLR
jgi:hypothetical protein